MFVAEHKASVEERLAAYFEHKQIHHEFEELIVLKRDTRHLAACGSVLPPAAWAGGRRRSRITSCSCARRADNLSSMTDAT